MVRGQCRVNLILSLFVYLLLRQHFGAGIYSALLDFEHPSLLLQFALSTQLHCYASLLWFSASHSKFYSHLRPFVYYKCH